MEADGRPGFLDWQSKKDAWYLSVAYFIGCALDIDKRRVWEAPLLAFYLERLVSYGVAKPPHFEEAWLRYRQSLIWPYFIFLNNEIEMQPEVNNAAVTNRSGMAVLDHDSFSLLLSEP